MQNRKWKISLAVMALAVGASLAVPAKASAGEPEVPPLRPDNWKELNLDAKVGWLLAQMTLAEKVEQMNIQPEAARKFPGLGPCSQVWNQRLGIGPILACDGPRGPKPSGARPPNRSPSGPKGPVSPTAHALASTWNPEILQQVGNQWGMLVKEYGLNTLFAPGLNLIKDPRCGRNTDYASEDPYLTGAVGTALVKGIQSTGVAATIKHLVANDWESGRQSHNVEVPMRSLRELYLPGFEMAVKEGGAVGIMTCYNALNGQWGSANPWLLTDVVRQEWGFKGFFVSDWGAQFGSAAEAVKAGQDLELPGQRQWNLAAIKAALQRGEITESDIDARVGEILRFKLGWMTYFGDDTPSGYRLEAFSKTMRRAGDEALVLLKNADSTLPLKTTQSIALIGPFAGDTNLIVGNAGSSTVPASYVVTVKDALAAKRVPVRYAQGGDNAFTYLGAQFQESFPCTIDYYNGQDLAGPIVCRRTAKDLILDEIKAGGVATGSITNGFEAKGIHAAGTTSRSPLQTPKGAWTVRVQLRLADQLPAADRSIMRFFANHQVLQITSSEFQVKVGDLKKSLPLNWNNLDNRWVELVVSFDGDVVKVFRDQMLLAEVAGVGSLDSQRISVGDGNQGLPMEVKGLAVWNTALAPARLAKITPLKTESFQNSKIPAREDAAGIPGIGDTSNMSLRASSVFTPVRAGKFAFQVETCGGVRVFIDGQLVYDLNDEQKAEGTKNQFWHIFPDTRPHPVVVEYRSKQRDGRLGFLRFLYAPPPTNDIFAQAVAAARAADVAVVCVGVPSGQQSENKDRPRIELPSWQDELILAVRSVNPQTVVVLFTEGGVDVRRWIDAVPAVIEAFHPGSEGGNIVADVLYGEVNPSGRLTDTWPKANDDQPTTGPTAHYPDTVNEFGYRYFEAKGLEPMFPFGYGLSYTTFAYDQLQVKENHDERYPVMATVKVTNTGKVAGQETVQVYVHELKSAVEQPVKKLGGFKKVELKPGESKAVEIPLYWTAFKYFDVKQDRWVLPPGDYEIIAARSAAQPEKHAVIKLE